MQRSVGGDNGFHFLLHYDIVCSYIEGNVKWLNRGSFPDFDRSV
jgi:hypothetical protein